jgi:ketosteroid isomerase-like protein
MGNQENKRLVVLALLGSGVGLYSREHPLRAEVLRSIAEGDWVAVELVLRAVTARGLDYENHYHFAFRVRDGRIAEVREHLDTQYAAERLFAGDG